MSYFFNPPIRQLNFIVGFRDRDGWRFNGDPCKLGVVTFDGYRIKPTKGENSCWYAVLVWSGRKPSPRFCATRDDLTSSTYYKRSVSTKYVSF